MSSLNVENINKNHTVQKKKTGMTFNEMRMSLHLIS